MNILVIDVGGTHVKILANGEQEKREIESGPTMTAQQMVSSVNKLAGDWKYDVVSVGYPGPVVHHRPIAEPYNLGSGWMGFDFAAAFNRPTKVINDAAMQALGGYRGGRMLFLGLGTGVGSTMIVDGIVQPMELGHLPYKKRTYEDYVGLRGLEEFGKKAWRNHVEEVVESLVAVARTRRCRAWRRKRQEAERNAAIVPAGRQRGCIQGRVSYVGRAAIREAEC
jgi:polyphosphate glucokinase